jgi:glycosyltransferase involved in cell wall biosynthesis
LGPNTISACTAVYNEEAVIERCLTSLRGVVDEIVLVHDGQCRDRTLEIARQHGARVFIHPRVGYSEHAKNFAFQQARGEWIFVIDADEFLSEPLREELRGLVANPAVNGYALQWPLWDGQRYFTEGVPYRPCLFRRAHARWVAVIHGILEVDPPVQRVPLHLEHRPTYNLWSLPSVRTKWRRVARYAARDYVMDLADIPHFGWKKAPAWPPRRKLLNRLSPLLILPYAVAAAAAHFYRERYREGNDYGLATNLRLSFYELIYAGMVQFYVAKYQYVGGVPALGSL